MYNIKVECKQKVNLENLLKKKHSCWNLHFSN